MMTRASRKRLAAISALLLTIPPGGLSEVGGETLEPGRPPAGQTSFGIRFGNDTAEGFVDFLVPVLGLGESAVLFVNPRFSLRDEGENEGNAGLGYRHFVSPLGAILGANVYFDTRESAFDNRFEQLGLGAEILTEWVDARFNYYLPEGDEELIRQADTEEQQVETSTATRRSTVRDGDPFATGNRVVQRTRTTTTTTTTTETTTTRRIFEQFEAALEGFDAEIGARLPLPDSLPEIRLFGGWYDFEGVFDRDIDGPKGRVEIRAPFLTLDAEIFDDAQLNGTDYFVGVRTQLPFDVAALASGKNPFRGLSSASAPRAVRDRLTTDMVMRDVRVQVRESELRENPAKRTVTVDVETTTEVRRRGGEIAVTNVTFVDDDASGSDGTAEDPFPTVQQGVDAANPKDIVEHDASNPKFTIFVFDGTYDELVTLADGQTLTSAIDIAGDVFQTRTLPVLTRTAAPGAFPAPPVLSLASDTTVRRMDVRSVGNRPAIGATDVTGTVTVRDSTIGGTCTDPDCSDAIGVKLSQTDVAASFVISDNQFIDPPDDGINLLASGAGANVKLDVTNNVIEGVGNNGIFIEADDGATVDASGSIVGNRFVDIDDDGIEINANGTSTVEVRIAENTFLQVNDDAVELDANDESVLVAHLDANSFSDIDGNAIEVNLSGNGSPSPTATIGIVGNSFLRTGKGVFLDIDDSGSLKANISDNRFVSSNTVALELSVEDHDDGNITFDASVKRNTFTDNPIGVLIETNDNDSDDAYLVDMNVDVAGNKFLRNGIGVFQQMDSDSDADDGDFMVTTTIRNNTFIEGDTAVQLDVSDWDDEDLTLVMAITGNEFLRQAGNAIDLSVSDVDLDSDVVHLDWKINDNRFDGVGGDNIRIDVADEASLVLEILRNDISGGTDGIDVTSGGDGPNILTIGGNTIDATTGTGIQLDSSVATTIQDLGLDNAVTNAGTIFNFDNAGNVTGQILINGVERP